MAQKKVVSHILHYEKDGKLVSAVGAGVGRFFIEEYFPKAEQTIRIASAYFRLSGYEVGKKHIDDKVKLCILVRKVQGSEEAKNVKRTVVKEIVSELGQCEIDLAEAVIDLLEKMSRGKFVIKEAREMKSPFHCKFYISDDKLFWHDSSNYSHHALTKQAEQVSLIEDFEQVQKFIEWYDAVIANARDLLEELKKLLEEWLAMAEPFDVYLKTLYLLFGDLFAKQFLAGAHPPSYFQKGVVSQALHQIEDFGGALVVAATGLGKTIIGAEIALRLWADKKINRVVLIAPHVVHSNWEREYQGREIEAYKIFNITVPFLQESSRSYYQINKLKDELNRVDSQTLIIIDEAHFYRNQLLNEKVKKTPSRVYELFQSAVKKNAKIVLLTATAFSTDFQNINSLLHLLPHKRKDWFGTNTVWNIDSPDEFAKMPIVTILGIPHVLKMARDRGDVENERVFVRLINKKIYFPEKLILHRVGYQLFLQDELQPAFDEGNFEQAGKVPNTYFSDEAWDYRQGVSDTIAKSSMKSWLSSPEAMKISLELNLLTFGKDDTKPNGNSSNGFHLNTPAYQQNLFEQSITNKINRPVEKPIFQNGHPFKGEMALTQNIRIKALQPIYNILTQLAAKDDDKFNQLKMIIENNCLTERGKVIVFVNRLSTAGYLEKELNRFYNRRLSVGCTVSYDKKSPKLKPAKVRAEILKDFSPRSHNKPSAREHNILICTEADGVGVNLQDANTLINYDPPNGADALFQRVGRILRMTADPNRVIQIYTFVPTIIDESLNGSQIQKDISEVFERLKQRQDKTESILGLRVLSSEKTVEINFDSDLAITAFLRDGELMKDIGGLGAESRLRHISMLEENQERASKVPDFIFSARGYADTETRMFVLLKHKDKYNPIIFNISQQRIEQKTELDILDIIDCNESEPRAIVTIEEVEHQANQAAQEWCKFTGNSLEEIIKICGLYLAPYIEAKKVENLFSL